jgi:hypothetical protein
MVTSGMRHGFALLLIALTAGCVDLARPAVSSPADQRDSGADGPGSDASQLCAHSGQCPSGFCVDGVCCNSACALTCHSCNLPGKVGICTPVPPGQDPRDACQRTDPAACQQDGACDGQGHCRLHPSGTECAPASCNNATEQAASTCDGAGSCRAGTSRSCTSSPCQNGSCGSACASDAACLTGFFCDGATCSPTRTLAAVCDRTTQCASGHCVDGVCCDSACTGTCSACNLPGTPGTCTNAAAGLDPREECPTEPVTSCGKTGACDGNGGCQLQPAGTSCAPASCTGSTETAAGTCSGLGVCLTGATRSCGAYVCSGSTCGASCTSNAQCTPGNTCTGTTCATGAPDAGTPDTSLLIDDFADADARSNRLGGEVTWDNQNTSLVTGEQKLAWNAVGTFQSFIEGLRSDACEYDVSGYTKVRFKMRASVAGKRVAIQLGIGTGKCAFSFDNRVSTVTLSTTMTTYDVDISRTTRDKVRTVSFQPTTLDGTDYFLDDVALVR